MAASAAAGRASASPRRATGGRGAPARKPRSRASRAADRRRGAVGARSASRARAITPPAGFAIPVAVGQRTAVAVGDMADSGVVVRLTRGRLWILLLAALLAGIVALNVLSLSFSASASRTARQADAIERENSILRGRLATDVSTDRVQADGELAGLYVPAPSSIGFLRATADDAGTAAERLLDGELSAAASDPVVAPPTVSAVAPTTTEVTPPTTEATPVAPAPAPTATPTATEPAVTDPAATTAPVPTTGAAPAP